MEKSTGFYSKRKRVFSVYPAVINLAGF